MADYSTHVNNYPKWKWSTLIILKIKIGSGEKNVTQLYDVNKKHISNIMLCEGWKQKDGNRYITQTLIKRKQEWLY